MKSLEEEMLELGEVVAETSEFESDEWTLGEESPNTEEEWSFESPNTEEEWSLESPEGTEEEWSLESPEGTEEEWSLESPNETEEFGSMTLGELNTDEVAELLSTFDLSGSEGAEDLSSNEVEIEPDSLEYIQCDSNFNSFLWSSRKYTLSTQFVYYSLYSQKDYLTTQLEKLGNTKESRRSKELVEYFNKHRDKCYENVVGFVFKQICFTLTDKLSRRNIVNNSYVKAINNQFPKFLEIVSSIADKTNPELKNETRFKVVVEALRELIDEIVETSFKRLFSLVIVNMIGKEFKESINDSKPLKYYKLLWCPQLRINPNLFEGYLEWVMKKEQGLRGEIGSKGNDSYESNHATLRCLVNERKAFQDAFSDSVNSALERMEKEYEEAQEVKFTNKSKKEVQLRSMLEEVENKIEVLNQDCIEEFLSMEIVLKFQSTIRELHNDFEFVLGLAEMDKPINTLGEWKEFCKSEEFAKSKGRLMNSLSNGSDGSPEFVPVFSEEAVDELVESLGEMSFNQLRRRHAVYPKSIELLNKGDSQRVCCPCGCQLEEPVSLFKFQYFVSSQPPKISKLSPYFKDVVNPMSLYENTSFIGEYRLLTGVDPSLGDDGIILGVPDRDQFREKYPRIPEPYKKFWVSYEFCPECGARIQLPFAMMRFLAAYHCNNVSGLSGGVRVSEYHRSCTLVSDDVDSQSIVPTFVNYNPIVIRNSFNEFVKNVIQNEGESSDLGYVLGTLREDSSPTKSTSSISGYAQKRNELSERFFSSYKRTLESVEQKNKESLVLSKDSESVLRAVNSLINGDSSDAVQQYLSGAQRCFTSILRMNQAEKFLPEELGKFNKFVVYLKGGNEERLSVSELLNSMIEDSKGVEVQVCQSLLPRVFMKGLESLKKFNEFLVVYGEVVSLQEEALGDGFTEYEYLDMSPTSSLRLREFFSSRLESTKKALREYRIVSGYYTGQRSGSLEVFLKRDPKSEEEIIHFVNSPYDYEIASALAVLEGLTEERVFFGFGRGTRASLGEKIHESNKETARKLLYGNEGVLERFEKVVFAFNGVYELLEKQLTSSLGQSSQGSKLDLKELVHSRGVYYRGLSRSLSNCLSSEVDDGVDEEQRVSRKIADGINECLREENCKYKATLGGRFSQECYSIDESYLSYLFVYKFLNESFFCGSTGFNGQGTLREYTEKEVEALPLVAKQFLNSYSLYVSLFEVIGDEFFSGYCHVIKQYLDNDKFKSQGNNKVLLNSRRVEKISQCLAKDPNTSSEVVLKTLLVSLVKLSSSQELSAKDKVWECVSKSFLDSYNDCLVEDSRGEELGYPLVFILQNNYSNEVAKSMLIQDLDKRRVFLSGCITDPEFDIDKLMEESEKFVSMVEKRVRFRR